MTQTHPLVTAGAVAAQFGTSTETIRRWARDGKLPFVPMPSGRIKFRQADIDALLPPAADDKAS